MNVESVMTYGHWGWPQIVLAGLQAVHLLVYAAEHGKPRTGNYNFPVALVVLAAMNWMYWMGGWWE